jgi:cell fate regulator YaaT (PSP1 superfamily)
MQAGREYLVHHGVAGHLGRFRSVNDEPLLRGATVVIRGRRGLELGKVLQQSSANQLRLDDEYIGDLLRPASTDDLESANQSRTYGQVLFQDAVRRAEAKALPISIVDVEVALDRTSAVLHGLRFAPGDFEPLLATLGEEHHLIVRLYEVNGTVEEDEHGCGSCGSKGGCSSCGAGGCSSCSSGAGRELAAYFAELRSQMENRNRIALV